LKNNVPIEMLVNKVNMVIDLHNNIRKNKLVFKTEYRQTQYLFEALHYSYMKILEILQKYCKAVSGNYIVLTGSAGNGKTNLLCSISELLINLKEAVVFLNSRDIEGDITEFLFNELNIPNLYRKNKEVYFFLVNVLLSVMRKNFFVIIDAINENDSADFGEQVSKFINQVSRYKCVRIIVSCRNEYYEQRFRKYLVENVNIPAFEFDLKEQHYTSTALDRIIKVYSQYFNYTGMISSTVKNMLSEQLLLLRIFFEVNKDGDTEVLSVRKHEIFAQYIEILKKNVDENIEHLLDTLVDNMLASNNFDEIIISQLKEVENGSELIRKIVDGSILIGKKLVFHEGTIARNESEVVYFVFDEMRDYYLAKRILLKNISRISSKTKYTTSDSFLAIVPS